MRKVGLLQAVSEEGGKREGRGREEGGKRAGRGRKKGGKREEKGRECLICFLMMPCSFFYIFCV